jgi:apolipoprotein N-acyltransferase
MSPSPGHRRPFIYSFLAGALLPLGFAPFGSWPLVPLSLWLLFRLARGRSAASAGRLGYVYGLGYFGVGVSWVQICIHDFGLPSYAFSGGMTLLFIAFLASFPALALLLARTLTHSPQLLGWLAWPACWTGFEWLRSFVLTGFPWLSLGYSQTDGPLGGLAPIIGVYGIGLLLVLMAGRLATFTPSFRGSISTLATIALPLLVAWQLGAVAFTHATGQTLKVSLVQGNIGQSQKWEPRQRQATLDLYRDLSLPEIGRDVVLWPETAIPAFQVQVEDYIRALQAAAEPAGTTLMVSMPYLSRDAESYFNSIIALGPEPETYFKQHLVPMGEYLPFNAWLRPWLTFLNIPMSSFTPGPRDQTPIRARGVRLGVTICYEDVFPEQLNRDLPEAGLLVNVSNDAWFGDSLAPHQHLQIARMRSLETGRWLLRATNTGISAIIGPDGRVVDALPQFRAGVLRGEVEARQGATPFVRFGRWPVLLAALLMGLAARWLSRPQAIQASSV